MNKKINYTIIAIIVSFLLVVNINYLHQLRNNSISEVSNGYVNFAVPYEAFVSSLNGEWNKSIITRETLLSSNILPNEAVLLDDYYVVYRAYVSLPEANNFYTILSSNINADFLLTVDDTILHKSGQFIGEYSKINYTRTHPFYTENKNVCIRLISTYDSNIDFSQSNIIIGTPSEIIFQHHSRYFFDLFIIVTIMFSGVYFLFLSVHIKENRIYLFFALTCIASSLRASLIGTIPLGMYFQLISLHSYLTLKAIITPIISMLLVAYFNQLFEGRIPGWMIKVLFTSYSLYIIFVHYVTHPFVVSLYHIGNTEAFIIMVVLIYKLFKEKNNLTFLIAVSTLSIMISSFLDRLSANENFIYGYSFSTGLLIFIVIHIHIFLSSSKDAFDTDLALSNSYQETLYQLHREETNYLSSHLKPHFLFNALNIVSGYALFDAEKAKNTTDALLVYLKQLFEHDNLNEMNSLENEISLVKSFGYIETERFPNITIEYDLPKRIPNIEVPSLILQPLLENAVNHGIRKRSAKAPGKITISIKEKKKKIEFTISDDGLGMDSSIKEKAVEPPIDNQFHSLYHLQLKLKELYNEPLVIDSTPNKGTTISFSIPV